MTNKPRIRIEFAPYFLRAIKQLQKRYPHIGDDIQSLVQHLETGETPGDQVPYAQYTVYKVRVRNRDAGRGKSGGYRVLYYVRTPKLIVLATIYSKSDQHDISVREIQRIIEEYERNRARGE